MQKHQKTDSNKESSAQYPLPPGETKETIICFIFENWESVCLFAYRCYLEQGRGLTTWDWKQPPSHKGVDFYYLPQKLVEENYSEAGLKVIEAYNPDEQIALRVHWDAKKRPGYKTTAHFLIAIAGKSSPKEIFMHSQN